MRKGTPIEIIEEKRLFLRKYNDTAGIYAMLRNGHVFYVGMSLYVGVRIRQHLCVHGYDCDFMLLEEIKLKESDFGISNEHRLLEKGWIEKFTDFGVPLINKVFNEVDLCRRKPPTASLRMPSVSN